MFRFFQLCFLLSFVSVFVITGCDDDDDASDANNLALTFDYRVGDRDFAYGDVYTINGTAVSFDFAQFYVSGIELIDDTGGATSFDDVYLLVNPDQTRYQVGELADGDYTSLNFDIGVDAATNSQSETDFTERPADDPLALQVPEKMHWNWNVGYIFLKINANVDTDGDGTPETYTEYHLGTDNLLTTVTLADDALVQDGEIDLRFQLDQLFSSIDLSTAGATHVMDNMPLAMEIADNYALAFRLNE